MALFGKQLTISGGGLAVLQRADGSRVADRGTINLDNILKLIPGDVVSLYLTGIGLNVGEEMIIGDIKQRVVYGIYWPTICFWICFAACVVLRIIASLPVGTTNWRGANWGLVTVTALAFFVWAHAVSPIGPVLSDFKGPLAGFVAMVLGLFAPLAAKQS